MRSGALRSTIEIQSFTNAVDDFGTPVMAWVKKATLRAEVQHQSAKEYLSAGAHDEETVIFRTRHLEGVTGADRVIFRGEAFNIREVTPQGRQTGLELRCEKERSQ